MKKIISAPYIDQTERWVNGCESISAVMLLQAMGISIAPDTFIERDLPHAPIGSRTENSTGQIRGTFTPATPPRPHRLWLLCALHRGGAEQRVGARGRRRPVRGGGRKRKDGGGAVPGYRRGNAGGLLGDAGLPARARTAGSLAAVADGTDFAWKCNEHCLLLVGYDEDHYWFNDPWHDHGLCRQPKALVEQCHAAQGMFAVTLRRR